MSKLKGPARWLVAGTFITASAALMLPGVPPAAARQDCVGYKVIASGLPVIFTDPDREEKARRNAVAAWEYLAAWQAGADHAIWVHADFRKIDCWLPDRSHTQCMAIGQPCTAPEEKRRHGNEAPAGD